MFEIARQTLGEKLDVLLDMGDVERDEVGDGVKRHAIQRSAHGGRIAGIGVNAMHGGWQRDIALASHPLVLSLPKAEAIYDELAAAHRRYLPERLLT